MHVLVARALMQGTDLFNQSWHAEWPLTPVDKRRDDDVLVRTVDDITSTTNESRLCRVEETCRAQRRSARAVMMTFNIVHAGMSLYSTCTFSFLGHSD